MILPGRLRWKTGFKVSDGIVGEHKVHLRGAILLKTPSPMARRKPLFIPRGLNIQLNELVLEGEGVQ